MRRRWQPKKRKTQVLGFDPDIRSKLDPTLLQNFAAACLTWNRVENAISVAFVFSVGLPSRMRLSVSSRINGIEGKLDATRDSLQKYIILDDTNFKVFENTLGACKEYKRYRDGIIHAYIADPKEHTAPTTPQKGKMDETLITADALDALYQRLVALYREMRFVVSFLSEAEPLARSGKPDDRTKIAEVAQSHVSRLLPLQKDRKSLPPLPKFPDERPNREGTAGG